MNRDAWYAAIAALGICVAVAAYALIDAPKLADPKVLPRKSQITASLPSPPQRVLDTETLKKAQTILHDHDPFKERTGASLVAVRSLDLPKLGRTVQFSEPGETSTFITPETAMPLPEMEAAPRAPMPQYGAVPPSQGSLTLRGVYPTPTGGRALVAMPDGSVVSVGVGGVVGGWRVLQIQQGAVRLGRGQRAILLAMPR